MEKPPGWALPGSFSTLGLKGELLPGPGRAVALWGLLAKWVPEPWLQAEDCNPGTRWAGGQAQVGEKEPTSLSSHPPAGKTRPRPEKGPAMWPGGSEGQVETWGTVENTHSRGLAQMAAGKGEMGTPTESMADD